MIQKVLDLHRKGLSFQQKKDLPLHWSNLDGTVTEQSYDSFTKQTNGQSIISRIV